MPPNLIENLNNVTVCCHQTAVVDKETSAKNLRKDGLLTRGEGQ